MRIQLVVIFFLLFSFCFGQQQLYFEQLPKELGLDEKSITDILQDHRGFLWFGTWLGLVRYDGYSTKVFRQDLDDEFGLKSNQITALFQDSQNRFWIGTRQSGLYRYDFELQRFINYQENKNEPNSLSNNNILAIQEDYKGNIWVGTEKGLNRFDTEGENFEVFLAENNGLRSDFIYSIAATQDGAVWIATTNGLSRMHEKRFDNFSLAPDYTNLEEEQLHNFLYKIKVDRFNPDLLWIGTKRGLKRVLYKQNDLEVQSYVNTTNPKSVSHNYCVDIWQETPDKLWVATFAGLDLMNIPKQEFRRFFSNKNNTGTLSNSAIKSLLVSSDSLLWIGTNKGCNKLNLNPSGFINFSLDETEESKDNNLIRTLKKGKEYGKIWCGTHGGYLNLLQFDSIENTLKIEAQFSLQPKRASDLASFITDMIVDKNENLWITTQGAGILFIDKKLLQSKGKNNIVRDLIQYNALTEGVPIKDSYFMSVTLSEDSSIWFGNWDGGLLRYDAVSHQFSHFQQDADKQIDFTAFPNVCLKETVEKDSVYLWVGTRGNGLYQLKYDKEQNVLRKIRHFSTETKEGTQLNSNNINDFINDEKGNYWIATESGLNRWNPEKKESNIYTEKSGLINKTIQTISIDGSGNIWIGTQNGISKLSPKNDAFDIQNFSDYDGLANEFFYDQSVLSLETGEIMMGGTNGISLFRPSEIVADTVPPLVVLTDFKLYNQSVAIGAIKNGRIILPKDISAMQEIELQYNENIVSLEFVGIKYDQPQDVTYAYKLEGFDDNWIYTDANYRIAQYTNLPYEEFVFKVKASSDNNYWGEPTELKIKILRPIWLTNGALVLYGILSLAIIFGFYRLFSIQGEIEHQLELEQIKREKAEEVDQLKTLFFTNISHELRTPLTLIISPIEQLLRENASNRILHRSLNQVYQNANKLFLMINQLLDIRRSEVGQMQLEVAKGNIVKFIREIYASFRPLAIQKNIQFDLKYNPSSISVFYDRNQMEKVLYNLLSNAFKFSETEGEIILSVELSHDGRYVNIAVEDTGVGIAANQTAHIFKRFYQAESDKRIKYSGTGIGLALSKSIVEKHKGIIHVSSEVGQGSRFEVQLPLGNAHFNENEIIPNFKNSEHSKHYLIAETLMEAPITEHKETVSKTNTQHAKILLVEDNAEIRGYLRKNLIADYEVLEAEDGKIGLEIALSDPPDLIVSDIAMPNMDGIEFCRQVKTHLATSHIPVILLTARTSLIFKIDGLETGADDYLTKPFNMQLLTIRIKNLIKGRIKLREKYAKNRTLQPSEITVNSIDEDFLIRLVEIIEKEMDNSAFTVEDLAKNLFLGRMQLYRKVKALTNETPNAIIRSIRLKRAAQLLSTNQYNVSEVTYMVGFQDLKYFRKRFKEMFGVSPSEYK